MTAEAILARIAAEGLQVNNCFQIDSGAWRAHLRRPGTDLPVGYAAGTTLAEALQGAFLNAMSTAPKAPAAEDVFA